MSALYAERDNNVMCPALYRRLEAISPPVVVANAGQPARVQTYYQHDNSSYTQVNDGGEYYRINCPYCRETRKRLWVSHIFGTPDANGRMMRFLACCYNENCLSQYENFQDFCNRTLGLQNVNVRDRQAFEIRETWPTDDASTQAVMPEEVIPLTQLMAAMPNHEAVRYMCDERGYSYAELQKYEVSYCIRSTRFPAAAGRIIFPIRFQSQFVGWQGRCIGQATSGGKYYTMPGMRKSHLLYNYDNAKTKPFVVVVEGVTDCHVLGDYGVAIFGKTLSALQRNILMATWPGRPIILLLDPDAREQTQAALEAIYHERGIAIPVILPEGFDCGSFHAPADRAALWEFIRRSAASYGLNLAM